MADVKAADNGEPRRPKQGKYNGPKLMEATWCTICQAPLFQELWQLASFPFDVCAHPHEFNVCFGHCDYFMKSIRRIPLSLVHHPAIVQGNMWDSIL
jgi:hypothetical protein